MSSDDSGLVNDDFGDLDDHGDLADLGDLGDHGDLADLGDLGDHGDLADLRDLGDHGDLADLRDIGDHGAVDGDFVVEDDDHGEHRHFANHGDDDVEHEDNFDDGVDEDHEDNGDLGADPAEAVVDDPGDDEDPEIDEFVEVDDSDSILTILSKEWQKIELSHQVSKVASTSFWEVGKSWFHRLFQAKELQQNHRKTPSFTHIRRKMYSQWVPKIYTETGYQNKDSGIVTVVRDGDGDAQINRFPRHEYSKLWEVAHVQVC